MRIRRPQLAVPSTRRRGMASVEIVLSMPMIVAVAALIYYLGELNMTRADVTVRARNDAWKKRTQSGDPESSPLPDQQKLDILFVDPDPIPKGSQLASDQSVMKARPLYFMRTSPVTVPSSHTVLSGTWDFHDLPIDSSEPLLGDRHIAAFGKQVSDLSSYFKDLNAADKSDVVEMITKLYDDSKKLLEAVRKVVQAVANLELDNIIPLAKQAMERGNVVRNDAIELMTKLEQKKDFPDRKLNENANVEKIINEVKHGKDKFLQGEAIFPTIEQIIKDLMNEQEY